MQEYQIRVCKERENLNDNLGKLATFLGSSAANQLNDTDLVLLEMQYDVMRTYSSILDKRIARFNQPA